MRKINTQLNPFKQTLAIWWLIQHYNCRLITALLLFFVVLICIHLSWDVPFSTQQRTTVLPLFSFPLSVCMYRCSQQDYPRVIRRPWSIWSPHAAFVWSSTSQSHPVRSQLMTRTVRSAWAEDRHYFVRSIYFKPLNKYYIKFGPLRPII